MLTEYVNRAMHQASYEILEDHTYYGEIEGFQGVYATGDTLEACRNELRSVLEGWVMLGLWMHHTFPVVDGLALRVSDTPIADDDLYPATVAH